MTTSIKGFFDQYRFLSNFFIAPVVYEGVHYKTSEHAYQAAKTFNNIKKREITEAETPNEAKRLGGEVSCRSDWETVKFDIMYEIVKAKFEQNPELMQKLMDTGSAYLEETNWWHDNTWGNCTCENCQDIHGRNMLGEILMRVRNENFITHGYIVD